jgi:integrase
MRVPAFSKISTQPFGQFGQFSQSSVYKSWKLACDNAEVSFFNPYQLRHSWATTLRAEGMFYALISWNFHQVG